MRSPFLWQLCALSPRPERFFGCTKKNLGCAFSMVYATLSSSNSATASLNIVFTPANVVPSCLLRMTFNLCDASSLIVPCMQILSGLKTCDEPSNQCVGRSWDMSTTRAQRPNGIFNKRNGLEPQSLWI